MFTLNLQEEIGFPIFSRVLGCQLHDILEFWDTGPR